MADRSKFADWDERKQMDFFAAQRTAKADCPHLPIYHFSSPDGRSNDPNGLCFFRGKWHLFYQSLPEQDERWHWGHAVSEDLINWQDMPFAIMPGPEDGSWSGSTLVEEDRVIAMYYGYKLGNMAAVSTDDDLLEWQKMGTGAVIPEPANAWTRLQGTEVTRGRDGKECHLPGNIVNFIYDPCIWKKDGYYYSLSGGTRIGTKPWHRFREAFLFRSKDLIEWEYLHEFLEGDVSAVPGDDCACPYFWPIGDKYILLHYSHWTTSHYMIGEYDKTRDKFIVEDAGDFAFGATWPGGILAPSACPDGNNGVIVMFNMPSALNAPGNTFRQIYTLPKRLKLENDTLLIEPVESVKSLRTAHLHLDEQKIPQGKETVLLDKVAPSSEIQVEFRGNAAMIELDLMRSPGKEEFTAVRFYRHTGKRDWRRNPDDNPFMVEQNCQISIDTSHSSCSSAVQIRAPETADFFLDENEPLKLDIFIDRSIVEVFANGRQCLSVRAYPTRSDSRGISVYVSGNEGYTAGNETIMASMDIWEMKPIPVNTP